MKNVFFKFLISVLILAIFSTKGFAETSDLKTPENLKAQGIEFYETGHYENALESFLAIPDNQKDEVVLLLTANSFESVGQKTRAIEILQRLILSNPNNYKPYYNIGNILQKNGDYNEAIQAYEIVIKANKDFAPCYYNKGICYYEMQEYQKALKDFKKAVKIDLNNSDYWYNLAATYSKLGNDKKAEEMFQIYKKITIQ